MAVTRYLLNDTTDITFPDLPNVPVALREARKAFGFLPDSLKQYEHESREWETLAEE